MATIAHDVYKWVKMGYGFMAGIWLFCTQKQ